MRIGEGQQVALEALHIQHVDIVEIAAGAREDHEHLLFHRQRRELVLLQHLHQALAARELRLRRFIEFGAELREGRQFAVLRQVQSQRARPPAAWP